MVRRPPTAVEFITAAVLTDRCTDQTLQLNCHQQTEEHILTFIVYSVRMKNHFSLPMDEFLFRRHLLGKQTGFELRKARFNLNIVRQNSAQQLDKTE